MTNIFSILLLALVATSCSAAFEFDPKDPKAISRERRRIMESFPNDPERRIQELKALNSKVEAALGLVEERAYIAHLKEKYGSPNDTMETFTEGHVIEIADVSAWRCQVELTGVITRLSFSLDSSRYREPLKASPLVLLRRKAESSDEESKLQRGVYSANSFCVRLAPSECKDGTYRYDIVIPGNEIPSYIVDIAADIEPKWKAASSFDLGTLLPPPPAPAVGDFDFSGHYVSAKKADRPPLPISTPLPKANFAGNKQASCTVALVVEQDGSVREWRILTSGNAEFDQAVSQHIKDWRFKAGRIAGAPVRCLMIIPVSGQPEF